MKPIGFTRNVTLGLVLKKKLHYKLLAKRKLLEK
jgi:hypothetical protein